MQNNKIQSKAILARLSIGMPPNSRQDKSLTDQVKAEHSLGIKSGRWVKQLYPDEALAPLSKVAGEARKFHYRNTLPWPDEGWGILPTVRHFEYTKDLGLLKSKFNSEVMGHFMARFDEWVEWAKAEHNGTFDMSQYDREEALAKCKFAVDFRPVPGSSQYEDSVSDIIGPDAAEVDRAVADAAAQAQREVWLRLKAPIEHMVSRLKDPDATFHKSLVGNLREIVELVPQLNLSGDTALDMFAAQAREELARYNPELFRDSKILRAETARKAEEILAKMIAYMPQS